MKKFISALCATSLSLAIGITDIVPSIAAPMVPMNQIAKPDSHPDFQTVQYDRRWHNDRRWNKRPRHHSGRYRPGHWQGYTGYRHHRHGYRRHSDGFWYPLAAFGLGAAIGGALANQPRSGDAHVQWCYDRYRSYRASDNTFQPYNGPRQQCRSPY